MKSRAVWVGEGQTTLFARFSKAGRQSRRPLQVFSIFVAGTIGTKAKPARCLLRPPMHLWQSGCHLAFVSLEPSLQVADRIVVKTIRVFLLQPGGQFEGQTGLARPGTQGDQSGLY